MTHIKLQAFLRPSIATAMFCALSACGGGSPAETASEPGAPTEQLSAEQIQLAEAERALPPTPAPEPTPQAAPEQAPSAETAKPEVTAKPEEAAKPEATAKRAATGSAKPSEAKPEVAEVKPAEEVKPAPAPTPAADTTPCGEEGQPMCPLQAFMENKIQKPLEAKDLAAVDSALARVAKLAPDAAWNSGTPSWTGIVDEARKAAKAGDEAALKLTCKSCHKAFRSKYKASFRNRPLL